MKLNKAGAELIGPSSMIYVKHLQLRLSACILQREELG